jgi:hypothetical protein
MSWDANDDANDDANANAVDDDGGFMNNEREN